MNVVYAVTENYIPKIMPSLRSLLEHNPKARVFLVTETDKVDAPVDVINVSDQKWFPENGVNYHNMFTYINLLKVVYPEILPVNKVIHLDADTIVCDSLEPMWKTDLKNKWVGAVPEYKGHYKPFGPDYFNMGVAVLNLAQMRKDNIVPWMVDYLNTVKQPWADQDAFNKPGIEQGKMVPVDVRFNESMVTGETNNPAVVHYCAVINWWSGNMHRGELLERYR